MRKEDAHPLITLRAKHNCAVCLSRLGKFRPRGKNLTVARSCWTRVRSYRRTRTGYFEAPPATVQARALCHAARATQAPSLDVGARSRLERAASLIPPPPEEPMRAEDALLGAFVQLALGQRRLDDSELELVEKSDRRRAALRSSRRKPKNRRRPPRSSLTPYPRRKRKQKPSAATRPALQRPIRRPSTR